VVTGGWRSTVIPPRSGMAWRLCAGQLLRIVDVEGSQSGDLFAVAADDLEDGQSNGRTFDMGGTIRLSTGSVLYSRRSRRPGSRSPGSNKRRSWRHSQPQFGVVGDRNGGF